MVTYIENSLKLELLRKRYMKPEMSNVKLKEDSERLEETREKLKNNSVGLKRAWDKFRNDSLT